MSCTDCENGIALRRDSNKQVGGSWKQDPPFLKLKIEDHIYPPQLFLSYRMESMDKYDKWNYWLNFGISIDKVGNTISQGSHHNTISARVGGCANTEGGHKKYWGFLEKVINWTFLPVDGPNHCYRAYLKEKDSTTFCHRLQDV